MENSKTKIALVTGGSRGLGKAMAIALAGKGIDVMITYHSNAEQADAVVAEVESLGRKARAFQLDTAVISSFDNFFDDITSYLSSTYGIGTFDFLINNAGVGVNAPVLQTTEEQFDQMIDIHYKGVFFLIQKALSFMNEGGGIVNVSSGLARFSVPGYGAYGSAKGAIEVLTRYLAKELGDRKIRVNVVAPGPIATDFGGGAVRDNKEMNAMLSSLTALGRVGNADDIGGVVAFLCTEDAKWVNGQRIEAAGGINL
ncbi:SDR family oxidoreductase [Robertkochia solimangrovi]|uniref:SDR family oxidoreductase n=1 Tax=Robertkochia solimangrovi TaxID=2213046 RepID=UPI003BAF4655